MYALTVLRTFGGLCDFAGHVRDQASAHMLKYD